MNNISPEWRTFRILVWKQGLRGKLVSGFLTVGPGIDTETIKREWCKKNGEPIRDTYLEPTIAS